MSADIEDLYDSHTLFENVEGWVGTMLKEELSSDSGAWERLANLCTNPQGKKIFR